MRYALYFGLLIGGLSACLTPQQTSKTTQTIAEQLDYGFPTRHCVLNDSTTVAYQMLGTRHKGIPLLFIHGLGSYMRVWDKNMSVLAQEHPCVRLDLPGYGRSSKALYRGNMSFYAQVIRDFCAKKGWEKVILVGHSMGGQIALSTALATPDLVEKLILFNPAGFETFSPTAVQALKAVAVPAYIEQTTDSQIVKNLAANFRVLPAEAQFMATDRQRMKAAADFPLYAYVVAQNIRGMLDEPVSAQLSHIQIPTLVFFGEKDALIPNIYLNPSLKTPQVMAQGCQSLPKAQCVLLPEAGHMSMWEKADSANATIKVFLK